MADDIAKEAREAIDHAYESDRHNREQMVADLRFRAGFQWSDEAIEERKGRPRITINRTDQFVRQVANPIRENMPTIKVEPDHDESSDMAEIANGLLRRIQYNSAAGHVYAQAVEHMVTCGIGYFRVGTDYIDEQSFDQEIVIRRIASPLSVYPDPAASEPDRSDMSYCVVSEMIPRKTFKQRWPDATAEGVDSYREQSGGSAVSWLSGDYVRIAEYWRRTQTKQLIGLFANPDGGEPIVEPIPPEMRVQIPLLRERGLLLNVRETVAYKTVMSLVSGLEQLEDDYECPCKWIPIIAVVGAEVPLDNGVYRHGLVRFQREPQQLMNYYLSVTAEILGQQVKAPLLATPAQISKHRAMWDTANVKARPYLLYDIDPQAPGPPIRAPGVDLASAFPQMAQVMSDLNKDVTGIYDAGLGNRSNETSGIAIRARVEQGNQATSHFPDNLEHSLKHAGRIMLDMIPRVYDTERTIRLRLEDDSERPVQINKPVMAFAGQELRHNDMTRMKFSSVRVIMGPSYATRRQETVDQLMQLIQAMPAVGQVAADILVKNMDFEGAEELSKRLKALLPPPIAEMSVDRDGPSGDGPPMPADMPPEGPPPPDPLQELEFAKAKALAEAEVRKALAEAAKEEARLKGVELDNALKLSRLEPPLPDMPAPQEQ